MTNFKDYRKAFTNQYEYLYIQREHNLHFTTMKKIGTKYDKLTIDSISEIGCKQIIYIK